MDTKKKSKQQKLQIFKAFCIKINKCSLSKINLE